MTGRQSPSPLCSSSPQIISSQADTSADEARSSLSSTPYPPGSYPRSPCIFPDSRSSYVPSTFPRSDSFFSSFNSFSLYVPANPQSLDVSPSFSPSDLFIPSLVPCSPNVLTNLRSSCPYQSPVSLSFSYSPTLPLFSCPSASLFLLTLAKRHLPLLCPCLPKSTRSVEAAIDMITTRPTAVTGSRTGSKRRARNGEFFRDSRSLSLRLFTLPQIFFPSSFLIL